MRLTVKIIAITVFLSLSACTPYMLEPLAVNHPAHPQAPVATMPPASQTLVHAAADLPARSTAAEQGGGTTYTMGATLRQRRLRLGRAK
ncbi:MAG: hypothetical protein QOF64_1528 [Candidatus Binatota bacterium]|jgi:hypothetical protein|nr:hypothetical protein [Candidatus Binatota bacterium]